MPSDSKRTEIVDILKYPHPCLSKEADAIPEVDEEIRELAVEMLRSMYESRGIGLAAPQVGVSCRLIVINLASDPESGEELVLVNPEIVTRDPEVAAGEEGCLSLPGVTSAVPRSVRVLVRARDFDGREVELEGEGMLARVLQHEIDHLDGILFISKISPVDRAAIKPKLRELKEKAP
jgi:peptide deformylase